MALNSILARAPKHHTHHSMAAMAPPLEDVRYGDMFGHSSPAMRRLKNRRSPHNSGTPVEDEGGNGDGGEFERYFSRGDPRGGEAHSPSAGLNVRSAEGLRAQLRECQVRSA